LSSPVETRAWPVAEKRSSSGTRSLTVILSNARLSFAHDAIRSRHGPHGNRLAQLANTVFVIVMTIMVVDGGYFFLVLFHQSHP